MNEQTGQPPSERACDRCRERRVKVCGEIWNGSTEAAAHTMFSAINANLHAYGAKNLGNHAPATTKSENSSMRAYRFEENINPRAIEWQVAKRLRMPYVMLRLCPFEHGALTAQRHPSMMRYRATLLHSRCTVTLHRKPPKGKERQAKPSPCPRKPRLVNLDWEAWEI